MVYRRTKKEMPVGDDEITSMLEEGIELIELSAPVSICQNNSELSLTCRKMKLGDEDESGRRRRMRGGFSTHSPRRARCAASCAAIFLHHPPAFERRAACSRRAFPLTRHFAVSSFCPPRLFLALRRQETHARLDPIRERERQRQRRTRESIQLEREREAGTETRARCEGDAVHGRGPWAFSLALSRPLCCVARSRPRLPRVAVRPPSRWWVLRWPVLPRRGRALPLRHVATPSVAAPRRSGP